MRNLSYASVFFVLALLCSGCGKDEAKETSCTAGEAADCVCESGQKSQKKCNDDGTGFAACDCKESPRPSTAKNKNKSSKKDGKGSKRENASPVEVSEVSIDAPGLSSEGIAKAQKTVELLQKLDGLMDGFQPTLPEQPSTSALQCVTTKTLKKDAQLSTFSDYLKIQVKKNKKERKQIERKFKKKIRPLHHRIDYGWKTRLASEDPIKYLYSGGDSAEKPELMKRMETSGLTLPERLFCVVDDMYSKSRKKRGTVHRVTCVTGNGDDKYFGFDLTTDALDVQRGDLVSAPVGASTGLDTAVLVGGQSGWLLYAKTETVKIEEKRAGCPDPKAEFEKMGGAEMAGAVAKQKKANRAARVKACYKRGPSRGVPWRYVQRECEKNPNRW